MSGSKTYCGTSTQNPPPLNAALAQQLDDGSTVAINCVKDRQHVAYEVGMLRYTTTKLQEQEAHNRANFGRAALLPPAYNALLESFAIHFRTVYQFLAVRRQFGPRTNDDPLSANYDYGIASERYDMDVNCETFNVRLDAALPTRRVGQYKMSEWAQFANKSVCHLTVERYIVPQVERWLFLELCNTLLTSFAGFLAKTGKTGAQNRVGGPGVNIPQAACYAQTWPAIDQYPNGEQHNWAGEMVPIPANI